MDNLIYKWNFSDNKNRGRFWYIIAISIVLWIAIWWVLTKQYWLTIIILLVAWVTFFIENNSAEIIEVKVSDLWIKIWEYFYDYHKIEKYWFIYNWENAEFLRIYLNKSALKNIDLKIDNKICQDLKSILSQYLEESEKSELSWSEKLINFLKL